MEIPPENIESGSVAADEERAATTEECLAVEELSRNSPENLEDLVDMDFLMDFEESAVSEVMRALEEEIRLPESSEKESTTVLESGRIDESCGPFLSRIGSSVMASVDLGGSCSFFSPINASGDLESGVPAAAQGLEIDGVVADLEGEEWELDVFEMAEGEEWLARVLNGTTFEVE